MVENEKKMGSIFSEKQDGTWFLYDESNPQSAEICIRKLSLEEIKEIRKLFVVKKSQFKNFTGRDYKRFEWEETDNDGLNEYTWTKCIAGWRRVLDENGNERPCTEENKLYLMYKVPEFSTWVLKCIQALNTSEDEQEETEIKN
jgi:hypothetical protein